MTHNQPGDAWLPTNPQFTWLSQQTWITGACSPMCPKCASGHAKRLIIVRNKILPKFTKRKSKDLLQWICSKNRFHAMIHRRHVWLCIDTQRHFEKKWMALTHLQNFSYKHINMNGCDGKFWRWGDDYILLHCVFLKFVHFPEVTGWSGSLVV